MNKDHFIKLVKQYNESFDVSFVEYIKQSLEIHKRISDSVVNRMHKLDLMAQQYADSAKAVSKEIRQIQKDCPHLVTTYEPDPSGNNDSSYTCVTCQYTSKRIKQKIKKTK